jgi:uncharacterized protein (TIGR03032 family)
LAAEINALEPEVWRPHPQGFPGNWALPLVSRNGVPDDDAAHGPMLPTPHLQRLPYTRRVIASLGAVVGRTRLMRLEAESEATPHVDVHAYWLEHLRVHVPVVTHPSVAFVVGETSAHMAPGETWVFDTWSRHSVLNPADAPRIHLVVDTVGSSTLWDLIERPDRPPLEIAPDGEDTDIVFEAVNRSAVMSPWEIDQLLERVLAGLTAAESGPLRAPLDRLRRDWRGQWAAHGDGPQGRAGFERLIARALPELRPFAGKVPLPNGQDAVETVMTSVLSAAVTHEPTEPAAARPPAPRRIPSPAAAPAPRSVPPGTRIQDPVIIVSPPRSGSTLLFEVLEGSPDLWSLGRESHGLIEGVPGLHPAERGWSSNRLLREDATPDRVATLHARFLASVHDRDGHAPPPGQGIRLLEKTPKNSLRIPFLTEAFPDARFILLYRDPIDAVASMLAGWRSGRFVTYRDLPGWQGLPWSYVLVPGWQELAGKPLVEIVAEQWCRTMTVLLDDLEELPADQWCVAAYGPLVKDPQAEILRLCRALDLRWDKELSAPLPLSSTTLTPPDERKREEVADELATVADLLGPVAERARAVFARPPGPSRRRQEPARATVAPASGPPMPGPGHPPAAGQELVPAPDGEAGFASEATAGFAELLRRTNSSILVSTYQSRRLIILRELDGTINTHFLAFESPMGIAADGPDLALAAGRAIWRFRDRPAVLGRLDPPGRHDACYIARGAHVTGDIKSHDLAYGDEGLWVVATLFSCLATIDEEHSIVPRWRPRFVSALAAEDRCHLNGLAMVDGRPGFVTCFGESDIGGGWRKDGGATRNGLILDVASSEPVARGLCMPHSPRWYEDQLWFLESGKGTLCVLDVDNGKIETVVKLPGFTRGLSFLGPYALVGLSQVRETVFDGVPVKEGDRSCGVWAVDTRSGAVAGFLRFSGTVQELYEVQALPGRRFPTVLEPEDSLTAKSFVLPDDALAEVAR